MYGWYNDFYYFLHQYLDAHALIIPLGVIGIWRWSVWLLKELVSLWYRPKKTPYETNVSIVTPVYNEDPNVFHQALWSWQENKPTEIIAVIDYTDKDCIKIFKEFAKKNSNAVLIITKTPGKRPALADGIKAAQSEIVALVDSDTIWEKDVLKNGLPPFVDEKVAGVGTYQNVLAPKTLAQKIFDTQLDLRYRDEMPFLAASGNALVCLSGRTAFYRREVILPMLTDLINETFMGKPVISGDDKRLTYLVLAAGWKVAYQSNSHVYTPGMKNLGLYLKQRLRWSRNALRADLRALKEGWPFKHPALVFFQFDKLVQSFVVVLSPIYFVIALIAGLWGISLVILLWWFISRSIKMFPHLKRRPGDIVLLPAFILYSFLTGVMKLYAFFTLNTQGWITRWDKSRLPQIRFLQGLPAYIATAATIIVLITGVFWYKQHTYFLPLFEEKQFAAEALPTKSNISIATSSAGLTISENGLLVQRHVVEKGESLTSVAQKYGIGTDRLLVANLPRLTNWNLIEPGFVLTIPGKETKLNLNARFNYQRIYADFLQTRYDQPTNTIIISGRGTYTTLTDIKNSVGEQYLKEISPKVWYLKANIYLRSGVALTLNKDEVTWLKMESNSKTFVRILGYNATILIDGVKITSWDETRNTYDTEIKDGRSYILVKDGSRMDINNSELAYLGYARTPQLDASPYGVSWRDSTGKLSNTLLTGQVTNSKFHHNYFGVFTYGATGMLFRGNQFYDNIRYGFDPHDDSNGFVIEDNIAHDNGAHGFIISKRCVNNVFRNNISYNNKLHGIMLHEQSNNNIIENNTIYGNTDGVVMWHSSNNLVKNNNVYNNRKSGIRANAGSDDNTIADNSVKNNVLNGIFLYDNSNGNLVKGNNVFENRVAIYLKTNDNKIVQNTINQNRVGIFLNGAEKNSVVSNTIRYSRLYGIFSQAQKGKQNYLSNNSLYRNRKEVIASIPNHPPKTIGFIF